MPSTTGTAAALEHDLCRRHGRYLRGLRVVARDGGVEVEGEAPDFYRKQLVIRDVLASPDGPDARIRVTVRGPVAGPRRRAAVVASGDHRLLAGYGDHLARAGFHVETAATGLECLTRLRATRPGVFVLVGRLPWGGSDGVLLVAGERGDLGRTAVILVGPTDEPTDLPAAVRARLARVPLTGLIADEAEFCAAVNNLEFDP